MGESIPAISIKQPWAELILRGKKKIEVRNWTSPYRGRLYLHTGKVADGYRAISWGMADVFRGGYIGIIELAAVIPFTEERWEQWRDQHLSDGPYRSGLYAWMIRNPRRFATPVPGPGQVNVYYPDPAIASILDASPLLDVPPAESSTRSGS